MNHRLGTFLFLLSWIFSPSGQHSFVAGFCVHPVLIFPRANNPTVVFPTKSGVILGLSADNNDNEDKEVGGMEEQQIEKKKNTGMGFLEKASEYLVLAAGAGVAITLTINLLGYGWVADQRGNIRFDSFENFRMERQLERSLRPVDETTIVNKNSNPVTSFFNKSPFITILFISIGWQILEESRNSNRKDQ